MRLIVSKINYKIPTGLLLTWSIESSSTQAIVSVTDNSNLIKKHISMPRQVHILFELNSFLMSSKTCDASSILISIDFIFICAIVRISA